jgi:hypothetical protein
MRNTKQKNGSLRKGLKQIHIGEDVWVYGKATWVPGKGKHMVIYGPNRKEYHVWGEDVDLLNHSDDDERDYYWGGYSRHGNTAIHAKVKIYVLTNILDQKENWCFNLNEIPENGPLKVICENGTVKKIEFNGTFFPQELLSKRITWKEGQLWGQPAHSTREFINVVGYRKS